MPNTTPAPPITSTSSAAKKPEKAIYVPRALRQKMQQQPERPIEIPKVSGWQQELEIVTGPVQVLQPLTDYLALESGCVTPSDQVFRRVVELGDFSKELKTSDLEAVLHSGLVKIKDYYDLRWIDDTHACVIFNDEITAAKALAIKDFQIKFKPFYQACEASKVKSKTFGLEAEISRRPRPDTSTVMAKRLLSRALNNPSIKANEEEETVLKKAAAAQAKK
jgi:hypothetical protein